MNYLLSTTFLTIIINVSIQIGTGYRYTIPKDILDQVISYTTDKVICLWKITHFLYVTNENYQM